MSRRSYGALGILALAALAASGASGGGAGSGARPARPQELEISIIQVEAFPYCAIAHTGPYTDMPSVAQDLVGAMQAQGLLVRILGPLVGVFYNWTPDTPPEDLDWDAGFVIEAQSSILPPLMIKIWDFRTVAAARYVGPYEKSGEAVDAIMDWLDAEGYEVDGPVTERFLDENPAAVDPDKRVTEIWVPCVKR
jgi:effector-binding domain-containing protein